MKVRYDAARAQVTLSCVERTRLYSACVRAREADALAVMIYSPVIMLINLFMLTRVYSSGIRKLL